MQRVNWIVVMGVSGSGKSSLAAALALRLGTPMIEGDDFHSPASLKKMRRGLPLDDEDRAGWLDRLCLELARRPRGAVLACSALKRVYRERLRGAVPRLFFIFLAISRDLAMSRVAGRAAVHPFPVSLVDSQFATLEMPLEEPDVLAVPAAEDLAASCTRVLTWLTRWPG